MLHYCYHANKKNKAGGMEVRRVGFTRSAPSSPSVRHPENRGHILGTQRSASESTSHFLYRNHDDAWRNKLRTRAVENTFTGPELPQRIMLQQCRSYRLRLFTGPSVNLSVSMNHNNRIQFRKSHCEDEEDEEHVLPENHSFCSFFGRRRVWEKLQ